MPPAKSHVKGPSLDFQIFRCSSCQHLIESCQLCEGTARSGSCLLEEVTRHETWKITASSKVLFKSLSTSWVHQWVQYLVLYLILVLPMSCLNPFGTICPLAGGGLPRILFACRCLLRVDLLVRGVILTTVLSYCFCLTVMIILNSLLLCLIQT